MNPFGATLVLLLKARDAQRAASESRLFRARNRDCNHNAGGNRDAGRVRDAGRAAAKACSYVARGWSRSI